MTVSGGGCAVAELVVDLGVLRSLGGDLTGLGTQMRANHPTTTLIPVGAAMMSAEVAAACSAPGPTSWRR